MSNTLHAVAPPPKTKEARQACTEKLALALAHFVTVASLRASSYPLAACFFLSSHRDNSVGWYLLAGPKLEDRQVEGQD
jgi:hypothetical protein